MMGLALGPLVRTLFQISLCVLTITLVVLVAWGLKCLYQQDSSPNMIFLCLSCLYQHKSTPKVVDSLKGYGAQIPCSLSKFETQFYSYSHNLTFMNSFLPL